MAESDTTSSVDIAAQDESAGSTQSESTPEQPVAQNSEPTAAVAVMDPPVDTPTPESAVVAEGSENNVTESVADGQEPIATPIESIPSLDPVPVAEEIPSDISEPAPVAVTTQPEGMAGGETVPVAEEPQDSASPMDIPAEKATETVPVSETGSTVTPDPSEVAEGKPTEAPAEISPDAPNNEVPTAVESEPTDLQEDANTAVPESGKSEILEDSNLDIPSIPVKENATDDAGKNPDQTQSVVIPTIPMRAAFLPVWSSQSRPGYSLRGLF